MGFNVQRMLKFDNQILEETKSRSRRSLIRLFLINIHRNSNSPGHLTYISISWCWFLFSCCSSDCALCWTFKELCLDARLSWCFLWSLERASLNLVAMDTPKSKVRASKRIFIGIPWGIQGSSMWLTDMFIYCQFTNLSSDLKYLLGGKFTGIIIVIVFLLNSKPKTEWPTFWTTFLISVVLLGFRASTHPSRLSISGSSVFTAKFW